MAILFQYFAASDLENFKTNYITFFPKKRYSPIYPQFFNCLYLFLKQCQLILESKYIYYTHIVNEYIVYRSSCFNGNPSFFVGMESKSMHMEVKMTKKALLSG